MVPVFGFAFRESIKKEVKIDSNGGDGGTGDESIKLRGANNNEWQEPFEIHEK